MSVNTIFSRDYLHELEGFTRILGDYNKKWKTAQTFEERLLIESQAVSYFQDVLEYFTTFEMVSPIDSVEIESMKDHRRNVKKSVQLNIARLKSISNQYLKYFNSQQTSLLELMGGIRKAKQKKATLSLWGDTGAAWIISESFLSLENLNTDNLSAPEGEIRLDEGAFTLPVMSSSRAVIEKISIGSKSTGVPGNSDTDVTTNNIHPMFMVDKNESTWFEYESDIGPLRLVLIMKLGRNKILNRILLEPVNLGSSIAFEIEDVIFNKDSKESKSLKSLVKSDVPDDFWIVKNIGNERHWSCTFLPVDCQTVTVILKQEYPYRIETISNDQRKVSTDRYAIGVRRIELLSEKFAPRGGINNVETTIPEGLFSAAVTGSIYPKTESLFKPTVDVSFDGGETWNHDVYSLPEENSKTMLLDGTATSAMWRLSVERKDDAFANAISLTDEDINYDLETLQKRVSRINSPVSIALRDKPLTSEVLAIQPKVAARTSSNNFAVKLGKQRDGETIRYRLPINFYNLNLNPSPILDDDGSEIYEGDVVVTVNGQKYNFVEIDEPSDIAAEEWSIGPKGDAIILNGDGMPNNANVKYRISPERLLLEERSDGYYHEMEFLFDPDKNRIRIIGLPSSGDTVSFLLRKGRKRQRLKGYKNITEGSVVLKSLKNYTYQEVPLLSDIAATDASDPAIGMDYFIDYTNGFITLGGVVSSDVLKVEFEHNSSQMVPKGKYSIVSDGVKPWGIRIDKNALGLHEVEDTVPPSGDASTRSYIDVITGKTITLPDHFTDTSKVMQLSHPYVVDGSVIVGPELMSRDPLDPAPVEMVFQDGWSEFMGLISMNSEETVDIISGSNGIVEFKLAAAGAVYEDLGVTFSDNDVFSDEMTETYYDDFLSSTDGSFVIGDYIIDYLTGSVAVRVADVDSYGTLKGGIKITYSYKDPTFDSSNRFSVDYRNGVIYTSEDMEPGSIIVYKAASYTIEYDIGIEFAEYDYNSRSNVVKIKTENMWPGNSLAKIIWADSSNIPDLSGLREYFSPVIQLLGVRFQ